MTTEAAKNFDGSELCFDQKLRIKTVEHELKKTMNRLERDKIATVFSLHVFAFNCTDRRHDQPHTFHTDYVAGGGRHDVPNGLQAAIKSLEHALAELKKKVQ